MSQMEISIRLPSIVDRVQDRLAAPAAAVVLFLRRAAERRELTQLSNRQLRDAGIDPSHAGRGKAAAVDIATLNRLKSLFAA